MKKLMILIAFLGLGLAYSSVYARSQCIYSVKCDSTKSCSSKKGNAHCKDKKTKGKKKGCCNMKTSAITRTFPTFAKKVEQYNFSVQ